MFQLHFENQVFSKISDFKTELSSFPESVQAALLFCQSWLSGEETFKQGTSGSTGAPKKIKISRSQLLASAKATGGFFKIQPTSKLLCCLNPNYIAGKMMLVRALVWDCPIWLVEPKSNPFSDLSDEISPDFVAMVPLQVEACLRDSQTLIKLQKVSHLIIGGAAISEKLKLQLVKNEVKAWQTYGMTETVSHIALAKITAEKPQYQTLPGVQIGQDERGAIWIKSPMSGPEAIQTNDLIELLSDSSFHWLGRTDFVINSGGLKLHPELLEQKLEATIQTIFPDTRFFLFGEKDEKLGEQLILILEKGEENGDLAKLLQVKMTAVLEKYEMPKKIYFTPTFVSTETGKINRRLTYQCL